MRDEGYVLAAEVVGASTLHVLFREILPNCLPSILTKMTLDLGFVILIALVASLPRARRPAADARPRLDGRRGRQIPARRVVADGLPGLAILVAVLGFNLVGDGLRDILDVER